MPFQVTARTLLQLGAELISSDAIAFYELIKNAFDAGSPRVEIDIIVRLSDEKRMEAKALLDEAIAKNDSFNTEVVKRLREDLTHSVYVSAPKADELTKQIAEVKCWDDLYYVLREANYIEIRDMGEGMSLDDLNR